MDIVPLSDWRTPTFTVSVLAADESVVLAAVVLEDELHPAAKMAATAPIPNNARDDL